MPTDDKPIDVLTDDTLIILYQALNLALLEIGIRTHRNSTPPTISEGRALNAIEDAKRKLDEINDRNEKRV